MSFFHISILVRRHKNKIRSIKNSMGECITDEDGIKNLFYWNIKNFLKWGCFSLPTQHNLIVLPVASFLKRIKKD